MSIKHGHTLNPVTALEFYSSHSALGTLILAGEGCYLKVFDANTSTLLCQTKILDDQAIHGIAVRQARSLDSSDANDEPEVAIWGGSCLTVFTRKDFLKSLDASFQSSESSYLSARASDWILDGVISPTGDLFLVTAHNTVLQAKISKKSLTFRELPSPSRSILYSAHLVYESNCVLIAAGTVFGEIIVWQCSHTTSQPECHVLHRFTGHEGSIFGVNISPVLNDRDGKPARLLASCSDDRTIRVWELKSRKKISGPSQEAVVEQDTGFGGDAKQVNYSSESLAVVMGHSSRIWSVQFHISLSAIHILSFGEDATTQYWELGNSGYSSINGNSDESLVFEKKSILSYRSTFDFHTGKHIWSKALCSLSNGGLIVVTGGADGKISSWDIPAPGCSVCQSWDLQDLVSVLPTDKCLGVDSTAELSTTESPNHALDSQLPITPTEPAKKPKASSKKLSREAFNKYAFVSETEILLTTTFGRVLLGKISSHTEWVELEMPSGSRDLKSYSVVKSIPDIGVVFLGSAGGTVFIYHSQIIQEVGRIHGKVADLFALCEVGVELLITTLGSTFATLFKIPVESSDVLSNIRTRQLTLPHKFVVTSAGQITSYIILGSRFGALAVYNHEKSDPLYTWSSIDSADSVTSIQNLPRSSNDSSLAYFLATSRDGTYSVFKLTDSLTMVHKGTPPFGPMIESVWFQGSELILSGFKSKNFIVWNETRQYEISSIECGGAHRNYAYSPTAGSEGAGHFVYTKASKMYLHSQAKPSHQITKAGGHGREIKSCAVSKDGLIATGAEDTAIRIWRYQDGIQPVEKRFNCLALVQKHTTGIQHLQWHGSSYLFSSGGNEEFFVWAVQSIPSFGLGLVCEASTPDMSEEQDLRIMSFDVSSLGETNGSEKLLISLAYSDSAIRCYSYSKTEGFTLVAAGRYTSSCLMQLRHLQVAHEVFLLTAGTDGHITVWKMILPVGCTNGGVSSERRLSSEGLDLETSISTIDPKNDDPTQKIQQASQLSIISSHRLHQSSVKALDTVTLSTQIIIATGGDDNALGITIYDSQDLVQKPRSILIKSAHAAAITGLAFAPGPSAKKTRKLRIVTSSNDQRVKDWELSLDIGVHELSVRSVGDVFTSIADVGDVATLMAGGKSQGVLVVGNGMVVYELSQ